MNNAKDLIRSGLHCAGLELYRYPEACERVEPHLKVLLQAHDIDSIIDVGANTGQFATAVRKLRSNVPLYSFEPNPATFAILQARASSDPLWRVFNLALGPSEGEITLNVTASDDFSSCLAPNELGRKLYGTSLEPAGQVLVPMRRADDVMRSQGISHSRSLFKMDTQGFDKQVLLGAPEVLRNSCIVLTECSIQPIYEGSFTLTDAIHYMEQAGFLLSGCFPLGRDRRGVLIEVNCAFVRTRSATE
jgi:FkbM family methyltransferase